MTSAAYAQHPSWIAYRDLIASRFNVQLSATPREGWRVWRGHRIHVDDWMPSAAPRGTAILVHGAGGHGRLLAPLADLCVQEGWRALAPDFPGYGLTETKPGWKADYAEWPALTAELADEVEGPVVLIGLSVGGFTALRGAQMAKAVKGVLATTLIDMTDPKIFAQAARWLWLGQLTLQSLKFARWLVDAIALPLALATPIGTLTTDPALRRYFETDPLLGGRWVSGRFFRTLHQAPAPRPDLALPCPLWLIHPGADEWTPTAMSKPAFEAIPSAKRFRELTNGAHLPLEQPARSELTEELSRFLRASL
jgi:alpha-beta hydrolase superfamily lysophospholipase